MILFGILQEVLKQNPFSIVIILLGLWFVAALWVNIIIGGIERILSINETLAEKFHEIIPEASELNVSELAFYNVNEAIKALGDDDEKQAVTFLKRTASGLDYEIKKHTACSLATYFEKQMKALNTTTLVLERAIRNLRKEIDKKETKQILEKLLSYLYKNNLEFDKRDAEEFEKFVGKSESPETSKTKIVDRFLEKIPKPIKFILVLTISFVFGIFLATYGANFLHENIAKGFSPDSIMGLIGVIYAGIAAEVLYKKFK